MKNTHQKGFVFRQENCVGCGACTIACQVHNELPENVRFRKVDRYEIEHDNGTSNGTKDVWLTHSCMHCGNPACLIVCPSKAYHEREDGIIVLDREKCVGCGLCIQACPYNAVVMVESDNKAAKCNMCIELIDAGQNPACVDGCPVECLKIGNVNQELFLPNTSKEGIGYHDCITKPNMVIVKVRA